jgi:hypothetical protein
MQALSKIGIRKVAPDPGQFAELRATMGESNKAMAAEGIFPLDLYQQMQAYLAEYRNRSAAVANGQ